MVSGGASIHATDIARRNARILSILLKDQTLSTPTCASNISWGTNDYMHVASEKICVDHFVGNGMFAIRPRAFKHQTLQQSRAKNRAEVFTPSWICNAQNNLIDAQWFGRENVFNTEQTMPDGTHVWTTSKQPVLFPEDKPWTQYIRSRRLEMACGEAPYLVSRYDTTTGKAIPLHERIGVLDRKFRIINENTDATAIDNNRRQWLRKAYQALQSVYGFDWQGDNVFLTRESVFLTFCEYYTDRWARMPNMTVMAKAAEIIAWNIWQMDGTRYTIPETDTPCVIMEWTNTEPLKGEKILFKKLIKK